ncbi:MAG: AMP-binding protein [Treponema sp.]|jgi:long-chain acyl-CoA synthetase|nr:AMP-binding protein [Treponema sp.]
MLAFHDYIADWPDMPYPNYTRWLEASVSKWRDRTAILYRCDGNKNFTRWSYARLGEECHRIAGGLLSAGLVKGDRVCLWAENRPEWIATWLGAAIAGLVIVPVDFLASEKECANILTITSAKAFFHSARKQDFADSLEISIPIRINLTSESYVSFGINSKTPLPLDIAENDPVSIVFTSGTMGFAKGVTLSHRNIIANTSAAILQLRAYPWDVFINVLPLHHTYPTTCSFMAPLSLGASIIIVEKLVGSVVVDDIRDAKGTFLIAVPLLYDKVMAAIEKKYRVLPRFLQAILNVLRVISLAEAKRGRANFGQLFLRIIRKKAGLASVRIMVAGGGPLNPKTADYFDSFGFNIVHGYGTSENSPLISVNTPWHKRNVSVGLPVKYTEIRILDPNEDGVGEIAVKSPSVMLGYYNNPEATSEVITPDGWLKTGDLGYRDEKGFLYINGRQKNLIVSSGGKNVYPEEIEAHFNDSRIVAEILILGRREKEFGGEQILAVVVPNYGNIAIEHPGKENDDAFVNELVKKEIERINRGLVGYKKITDFIIRKDPFEKNAQHKIRRFLYKSYETAT